MKRNKTKIIISVVFLVILISFKCFIELNKNFTGGVFELFRSDFFLLLIVIVPFAFEQLKPLISNSNEYVFNQSNNYFESFDRTPVVIKIGEEARLFKKDSKKIKVLILNCQNINAIEIKNIKYQLYNGLSSSNKDRNFKKYQRIIGDIKIPQNFDIESFCSYINSLHKYNPIYNNYVNLLILDDQSFDLSDLFRVNQQKINKKVLVVHLTNNLHYQNKMNNIINLNELKHSNLNYTFKKDSPINYYNKFIDLIETNIENDPLNAYALKKVIDSNKIFLDMNENFIIPLYYNKIGNYEKALQYMLANINSKFDETTDVYRYILADTFHLNGEYIIAASILKNISNKSAFVTKLEMHLEKHLGNFSNYSATTDYSNLKLLSIAMIDLIDKSINNVVAKKINFVTANNPNLDINKYEIKTTEISNYNMYRAVFLASDNKLNEALELINNCIAKFESENDHYYYNAYYIKPEILRIMNDFSEAYKFYLKSSGILDDHVDINLLDQNYFSTKSLELLGYVHGDASDRIIAYKENHYDKLNHKKYISNIKIPEMYDECLKEKINLRFNQKILNIINETSLNDKDWNKLKTILLNNIFIIL